MVALLMELARRSSQKEERKSPKNGWDGMVMVLDRQNDESKHKMLRTD